MKKILTLVFVLVSLLFCVEATAETVRNASNSSIGYINSDGSCRIDRNSMQFKIHSDGTIRSNNGATLGKLDGSTVRNSNNATIGTIGSDGTVRLGATNVGKISSDGTVRNSNGQCLGYAKGVKKEWVAIFFFFIEKLK